jgi:hypothetical protein
LAQTMRGAERTQCSPVEVNTVLNRGYTCHHPLNELAMKA